MPDPSNLSASADPASSAAGQKIECGDPRQKPASFSRFVLPLPYCLTEPSTSAPDHWFDDAGPGDWLHRPGRRTGGPPAQPKAQSSPKSGIPSESRTTGGPPAQPEAQGDGLDAASLAEVASLDQQRFDYFTRETSEVLYRRARWLILKAKDKDKPLADWFRLSVLHGESEQELTVRMSPPALVLFECPQTPNEAARVGLLPQGMLVIDLWWESAGKPDAPQLNDLLVLNELFRYFFCPFERHARYPEEGGNQSHNYRRALADLPIDWRTPERRLRDVKPAEKDSAQGAEPQGTELRLGTYLKRWDWILECPIRFSARAPGEKDQYWRLMPQQWIDNARLWACGCEPVSDGSRSDPHQTPEGAAPHGWLQYADHRAFVWTCAVLADPQAPLLALVKELGKDLDRKLGPDLGHWLRLVNMDPLGPDPAQCTPYEAAWADKRTYRRWAHYGALQGFNYHGGAMLTGVCVEPPTWRHFGAMYFDVAILLLYVRATLFRFGYQMSQLSAEARHRDDDQEAMNRLEEEFESVRLDFALFTNLYQFPLLSNQQQGIELYALCREQMDVDALFREVESEVKATHEFLALRTQHKIARLGGRLTVVATVGLFASLLLMAFGVSDFASVPFLPIRSSWWLVMLLLILGVGFFGGLLFIALRSADTLIAMYSRRTQCRLGVRLAKPLSDAWRKVCPCKWLSDAYFKVTGCFRGRGK